MHQLDPFETNVYYSGTRVVPFPVLDLTRLTYHWQAKSFHHVPSSRHKRGADISRYGCSCGG